MEPEIIIIPDIHGRTFWRDAIPYIQDGTPVIFLGDYLDPYPHENISSTEALKNFKEILEIARGQDNVALLIGNHDCTYIWPEARICECRTDYKHLQEIHQIFQGNLNRFRLFYIKDKFLFTHAGVHPRWLGTFRNTKFFGNCSNTEHILQTLDNLIHQGDPHVLGTLSDVGRVRGGWSPAGSCVWADIREFDYPTEPVTGYIQIVGHSQQLSYGYTPKFWWKPGQPVRMQNVICLDCHQCFYLDSEGDIRFLKDDKIVD